MIWDIIEQSTFDKYFQDPTNLTIQTLLLDQNIITEFKNLNPKLIQFLQNHKQEFLSKLIQYTVILPDEKDEEDRIRKLPYVSSEVLSIDNQLIFKSFLVDNQKQIDYFSKLVEIMNTSAAQNQILLGYFVKIIQNLYKSLKKQIAQRIYQSRDLFYKHLNKQSIGNVLKLLLILLQTEDGFMLQQRKQVIQKLIQSLCEGQQDIKIVAKNVLVEVIMKFQTFSSGDELLGEIVNSEKLVEIFEIKDSQAIDEFLIRYLSKALQKICAADNSQKEIISVSQIHKELIRSYIKSKKHLISQTQTQSIHFKNQIKKLVTKTDKKILNILSLMKLGLQNNILDFLSLEDIQNLWRLIQNHEFNDIIKVKVFEIFTLIYNKKDEIVKDLFEKGYFQFVIKLFNKSKQMFGYFLYQLWKVQVMRKSKIFMNNAILEEWGQDWKKVMEYFKRYENYEEQIKKVIDRYSNRTKVVKLVVDQEDTVASASKNNVEKAEQNYLLQKVQIQEKMSKVQIQVKKVDDFDFSFEPTIKNQPNSEQKISSNSKLKSDPFGGFDFFDMKQLKQQKKVQQKNNKADFTDFSAFF